MEYQWYTQQLREKIGKVLDDRGSSFSLMDEMTEYIGRRMTSDSAQFHAMKVRERGGSTIEILEAGFYGAFGIKPRSGRPEGLDSESQTPTP